MNTIQTKETLKSWFVKGAIPTESQFNDLITTFVSHLELNIESEELTEGSYSWEKNLNPAGDGSFIFSISRPNNEDAPLIFGNHMFSGDQNNYNVIVNFSSPIPMSGYKISYLYK